MWTLGKEADEWAACVLRAAKRGEGWPTWFCEALAGTPEGDEPERRGIDSPFET